MGAVPERHTPMADGRATGQPFGARSQQSGASPSPKISLVTTAAKLPSWYRSVFNLDFAFRNLMLLAALAVLAVVLLIVRELLEGSRLAWHQFGIHFFFGSEWDPVSGAFGAFP